MRLNGYVSVSGFWDSCCYYLWIWGGGLLLLLLVWGFSLWKIDARDTNLLLTPVTSEVYVKIYHFKLSAGEDVTIIMDLWRMGTGPGRAGQKSLIPE